MSDRDPRDILYDIEPDSATMRAIMELALQKRAVAISQLCTPGLDFAQTEAKRAEIAGYNWVLGLKAERMDLPVRPITATTPLG